MCRMRHIPDKTIHPMRGVRSDGRCPAEQTLGRPLQQRLVMGGHMGWQAAVLTFAVAARMLCHDLAGVIQGDGMLGQMSLQPLALLGMRHGVIVLFQIDVVVLTNQYQHHFGVVIGIIRQRLERRSIELGKQ